MSRLSFGCVYKAVALYVSCVNNLHRLSRRSGEFSHPYEITMFKVETDALRAMVQDSHNLLISAFRFQSFTDLDKEKIYQAAMPVLEDSAFATLRDMMPLDMRNNLVAYREDWQACLSVGVEQIRTAKRLGNAINLKSMAYNHPRNYNQSIRVGSPESDLPAISIPVEDYLETLIASQLSV